MKQILLINIDSNDRSAYSAQVAAILYEMNNWAKITLITSSDNEVMNSLALFENVHLLDEEKFFEKTKNLSEESTKREIKNFLSPLLNTQWDHVVNLSADPLGAIFASYLQSKITWGPTYDSHLSQLSHNNFFSLLLNSPFMNQTYPCHITTMHQGVVDHFSDFKSLPLVWKNETDDLIKKIEQLKSLQKKTSVVAIDAALFAREGKAGADFVFSLYRKLSFDKKSLPILFCENAEDYSYLIDQIREGTNGELHILSLSKPTQLSSIAVADIIVTDNLYLKSLSDLMGKRTVFLAKFMPYSDFSMIPGSHLIHYTASTTEMISAISAVCMKISENQKIEQIQYRDLQLYETVLYGKIPFLLKASIFPENYLEGDIFARWSLLCRFFMKLNKNVSSIPALEMELYRNVIKEERQMIRLNFNRILTELKNESPQTVLDSKIMDVLENDEGLLSLVVKHIKMAHSGKPMTVQLFLESMKPQLREIMDFFNSEEGSKDTTASLI